MNGTPWWAWALVVIACLWLPLCLLVAGLKPSRERDREQPGSGGTRGEDADQRARSIGCPDADQRGDLAEPRFLGVQR